MGKKATKSVKNLKGSKKLYEAYERGYFLLKDGKVYKNIVNGGKDTIIMTPEDRNVPMPKKNRKGEG